MGAVALTTLTINTWTAGTTAGTLTTLSDTAEISVTGPGFNYFIAITNATSTLAVSATVLAGDRPPALNQGQGASSSQAIAVGATYFICLDQGRFLQNDDTVRITFTASTDAAAVRVMGIRLPRGA